MNPLSWITSALGGVWGYVAALAIGAVVAGGGVWYVTHTIDDDKYVKLQLADQKVQTDAVTLAKNIQAAQDKTVLNAAVAEAKAQDALDLKFVDISRKVPVYVNQIQEAKSCITIGLYRVLAGASGAADPDSLQLAPGQSNDDCADVTEASVAYWFTGSGTDDDKGFGVAAFKNAEQLNGLEDTIRKMVADYNQTSLSNAAGAQPQ